jgi:hypothetical protein
MGFPKPLLLPNTEMSSERVKEGSKVKLNSVRTDINPRICVFLIGKLKVTFRVGDMT